MSNFPSVKAKDFIKVIENLGSNSSPKNNQ
jgi:hypothetical protein